MLSRKAANLDCLVKFAVGTKFHIAQFIGNGYIIAAV
jgi:hypothetical protein